MTVSSSVGRGRAFVLARPGPAGAGVVLAAGAGGETLLAGAEEESIRQ